MCGIAGIIYRGAQSSTSVHDRLAIFSNAIAHRGPNDSGTHITPQAGFLNRRLSIVDRAGGNQPIYSTDRKKGIVFNGEVYNHNELREELESKGFQFTTRSDTEVVLRLFEAYGPSSFARLNGMFAFALWDDLSDEVWIARDHFGIKPLYLYEDPEKILFCSEIKGILAQGDVDTTLSPAAVQDYITFRYTYAPLTIFKRIHRLEPGTSIRIHAGQSTRFRFFDLEFAPTAQNRPDNSYQEDLLAHLRQAVRSQLMGEVPIGVLLSGGVDSSAIAYCVHTLGANLTTFNIGFPDVNEFEYSRAVAERYGLQHREITFTLPELIARYDQVLWALDEPLADPACFPLYRLCEELRKEVTVVLSGEGADEQLAGYPQYLAMTQCTIPDLGPEGRFTEFLKRSYSLLENLSLLRDSALPPTHLRNYKYFAEQSGVNSLLCFDQRTWLPDNLMMKADKILMAHSLEGRFPFLDLQLNTFCAGLPIAQKISPTGVTKYVLKEALRPHLPDGVISRPKMGFSVPLAGMLNGLADRFHEDLRQTQGSSLDEILDIGAVSEIFHRSQKQQFQHETLRTWTLLILVSWFNKTVRGET